ncbi:MAG: MBL fold metallo-hydrolase [Phycisphaerae bacterium]|nr:MBL fold metallo-hydrolase [Phycisphaerae bacterium]
MISTCALQSGSSGNCFYVETRDVQLLFDAGISAKQAYQRLSLHGRDIANIKALLISHDHSDHSRHAGIFHRRTAAPLYMTHGSWKSCKAKQGAVRDVNLFDAGSVLQFGQTVVQTVPTAHDGKEGVAFVISSEGKKLGIFTDLGHRFDGIEQWLTELDGLYLESNYDPEMLAKGAYPPWLKKRITGDGGHLSNRQAADLVLDSCKKLQRLILSHLSEHNNSPNLASQVARDVLGPDLNISMAPRKSASEMFIIA